MGRRHSRLMFRSRSSFDNQARVTDATKNLPTLVKVNASAQSDAARAWSQAVWQQVKEVLR